MYDTIATKFSVNECGIIIQYKDPRELPKSSIEKQFKEAGDSRRNRQKRQIANAMVVLGRESQHKPTLFVLTCPVKSDYKTVNKNVSKFFNNITKPHSWGKCNEYVWCREYQDNGRPHWHVCADIPKFPIKKVNNYWSMLWNSKSTNSIRFHSKANRFLKTYDQKFAWYLTKYFTKTYDMEKGCAELPRKFGISQALNQKSKPITLCAGFDNVEIGKVLQGKKGYDLGKGVIVYR